MNNAILIYRQRNKHVHHHSPIILFATLFPAGKLVFCYYSSFARSRPWQGRFQPEDIDPNLCTHVIYAFVDMQGATGLRPNHWLDYGTKFTCSLSGFSYS